MKYIKETLEIPKLVDKTKIRKLTENINGQIDNNGILQTFTRKKNSLKLNLIIFFLFIIFFVFFLLNCKNGIFKSDLDIPVPYYNYYPFLKGTE